MDSKYFKIPNEYQDAKCRLRIPGQAVQVLAVIERYTFGWNKKDSTISFRTFRKMTGMDDSHIIRSRSRLLKIGVITTTQQGKKNLVRYRIQTDYTKWKPLPYRVTTQQGKKTTTQQGKKPLPNKETPTPVNKDIPIKDILFKDRKTDKIKQLKIRKNLAR